MGVWEEIENEAKEEGRAEGRAEGRVEGRIEGKEEAAESIARRLITAGVLALEEIADICSLSMQHVERLARSRP